MNTVSNSYKNPHDPAVRRALKIAFTQWSGNPDWSELLSFSKVSLTFDLAY